MLKKLSEKLRAKFPATTRSYSMVKIACLDALLDPVEGQSLQPKEKETSKTKGEKSKKTKKPKGLGHFLISKF